MVAMIPIVIAMGACGDDYVPVEEEVESDIARERRLEREKTEGMSCWHMIQFYCQDYCQEIDEDLVPDYEPMLKQYAGDSFVCRGLDKPPVCKCRDINDW